MRSENGMPQSQEFDFDAIEAAVKETERGRWFLSEYDRRRRGTETQVLLEAIAKLDRLVATARQEDEQSSPAPAAPSHTASLARLAVEASAIAAEIAQLSDIMDATSASAKDDPESMAGAMAHLSQRLIDIGAMQDVLASGLAEAAKLLSSPDHVFNREIGDLYKAAAELEKLAREAPRAAPAMGEESLKYFSKDEELFSRAAPQAAQVAPPIGSPDVPPVAPASPPPSADSDPGAKARIVIVRTPSSNSLPIPLAEDAPGRSSSAA